MKIDKEWSIILSRFVEVFFLEEKMLRVMFAAPSDKTIKSVIINEDFINSNVDPIYVREEKKEAI